MPCMVLHACALRCRWDNSEVLASACAAHTRWLAERHPDVEQPLRAAPLGHRMMDIAKRQTHLSHCYTLLREAAVREVLGESQLPPSEHEGVVEASMAHYLKARSDVVLFDGALEALRTLKSRGYVLAALSNGNADVHQVPALREAGDVFAVHLHPGKVSVCTSLRRAHAAPMGACMRCRPCSARFAVCRWELPSRIARPSRQCARLWTWSHTKCFMSAIASRQTLAAHCGQACTPCMWIRLRRPLGSHRLTTRSSPACKASCICCSMALVLIAAALWLGIVEMLVAPLLPQWKRSEQLMQIGGCPSA